VLVQGRWHRQEPIARAIQSSARARRGRSSSSRRARGADADRVATCWPRARRVHRTESPPGGRVRAGAGVDFIDEIGSCAVDIRRRLLERARKAVVSARRRQGRHPGRSSVSSRRPPRSEGRANQGTSAPDYTIRSRSRASTSSHCVSARSLVLRTSTRWARFRA